MTKQKKNYTRDIGKDVIYGSNSIQRLINMFTKEGKKQRAEKIVYGAIEDLTAHEVAKNLNMDPAALMEQIVVKVSPTVEAVGKRIKGSTLPVPQEVRPRRGQMLAFRWLRTGAIARRAKDGSTLQKALSHELAEALQDRGFAIKRREEVHATAKANRAFAHFATRRQESQ